MLYICERPTGVCESKLFPLDTLSHVPYKAVTHIFLEDTITTKREARA